MLSPSFSLCRLLNGIEPPCLVHLFTARWRLNNLRFIAWNNNYFYNTERRGVRLSLCSQLIQKLVQIFCIKVGVVMTSDGYNWGRLHCKPSDRAGPCSFNCFNWELIDVARDFSRFSQRKTRFLFYLDTAWSVYSRETISWGHETPKISDSLKRFVWKRKRISFISHILQLLY